MRKLNPEGLDAQKKYEETVETISEEIRKNLRAFLSESLNGKSVSELRNTLERTIYRAGASGFLDERYVQFSLELEDREEGFRIVPQNLYTALVFQWLRGGLPGRLPMPGEVVDSWKDHLGNRWSLSDGVLFLQCSQPLNYINMIFSIQESDSVLFLQGSQPLNCISMTFSIQESDGDK